MGNKRDNRVKLVVQEERRRTAEDLRAKGLIFEREFLFLFVIRDFDSIKQPNLVFVNVKKIISYSM